MKQVLPTFTFFTLLFFLYACNPCKQIVCDNGGTCRNGACECPAGYGGSSCELELKKIFLGNFQASETCQLPPGTMDVYPMSILSDPDAPDQIIIQNIYGLDRPQFDVDGNLVVDLDLGEASLVATVTSATTFDIYDQTLNGRASNLTFIGSGNIVDETITITYTMTDNTLPDEDPSKEDACTATLMKQ